MKMMIAALFFVFCAIFASPLYAEETAPVSLDQFEKNVYSAVVLHYAQLDGGDYRGLCTATAFERVGKTYRFVTAAHCLAEDDVIHERVNVARVRFFTTTDEEGVKSLIPVKVLAVGYQHNGDDLAVFEATLDKEIPVIPFAAKNAARGENVINVAGPLGLGKQLFRGHVSSPKLDRPVIDENLGVNWDGAMMLQISCGSGSSGSAIVSPKQGGIVGILVGTIGARSSTLNVVAIPVERFHKFWKAVKDGKYRWYRPDDAANVPQDPAIVKRVVTRARDGLNFRLEPDKALP